ncbi:L-asparagine oxygenase [Streptomyces sp. RB5]|uniref:L-asparagine oxygenase n=1 Tax=Streptomyces smaragdinus TaxID=2585196 RepID=A0A7K0CEW4_9ACTN|nr:TauD/TfdA family dioxygenase [Streptomyces smaragdinus]MQY11304.1 L-asparagine oxygenase [Streptomyces smaragdinus]
MPQPATMTAVGTTACNLTVAERRQTGDVALRLAGQLPASTDDAKWIEAVRDASCSLPPRLLAQLRAFRHDAGPDGALLVRNLPVAAPHGPGLPRTPTVAGSVEHTPTVAAAVVTAVMSQLGEVIAYRNEKSGALVQNVVPVPGSETSQSNAGSVLLEMHTENAFHDSRPDYVGLLCLREDPTGDARLTVSSVRKAVPLLRPKTRAVLSENRFLTVAPPSFGDQEDAALPHAVLRGSAEDPDVLVDFSATHPLDDGARAALAELRQVFFDVHQAYALRVGDLAVVDNRLAVHGRTSFAPRFDGTDRWLHRVYASLDNRRSRPYRAEGTAVLG